MCYFNTLGTDSSQEASCTVRRFSETFKNKGEYYCKQESSRPNSKLKGIVLKGLKVKSFDTLNQNYSYLKAQHNDLKVLLNCTIIQKYFAVFTTNLIHLAHR